MALAAWLGLRCASDEVLVTATQKDGTPVPGVTLVVPSPPAAGTSAVRLVDERPSQLVVAESRRLVIQNDSARRHTLFYSVNNKKGFQELGTVEPGSAVMHELVQDHAIIYCNMHCAEDISVLVGGQGGGASSQTDVRGEAKVRGKRVLWGKAGYSARELDVSSDPQIITAPSSASHCRGRPMNPEVVTATQKNGRPIEGMTIVAPASRTFAVSPIIVGDHHRWYEPFVVPSRSLLINNTSAVSHGWFYAASGKRTELEGVGPQGSVRHEVPGDVTTFYCNRHPHERFSVLVGGEAGLTALTDAFGQAVMPRGSLILYGKANHPSGTLDLRDGTRVILNAIKRVVYDRVSPPSSAACAALAGAACPAGPVGGGHTLEQRADL